MTPYTLLERMLDAAVKLGTSTPGADPSGDYAWEVFRKADAVRTGSFAALENKAMKLTGGSTAAPPGERNIYGALVSQGRADIFLAYRTAALVAQQENPEQQIVALPAELAVGANYGLTLVSGASVAAHQLALFILAKEGQSILVRHGFHTPCFSPGTD